MDYPLAAPTVAAAPLHAKLVVDAVVFKALVQVQAVEHGAELQRCEVEFRRAVDSLNKDWESRLEEVVKR